MTKRYAIYFAPPTHSALCRFGSRVLGYDAATGEDLKSPSLAGLSHEAWQALTAEPRRYGFHATLKAPFELASRADEAGLVTAAGALARELAPVTLGELEVREIGRFIALVPVSPSQALQDLAGRVVDELDELRAPLAAADRARRLKSPLSAQHIAYLDRYGYPYVHDAFRFHMTLTGPIDDPVLRGTVRDGLAGLAAETAIDNAAKIDALAIYRQPSREQRFRIISRLALGDPPTPREHQ